MALASVNIANFVNWERAARLGMFVKQQSDKISNANFLNWRENNYDWVKTIHGGGEKCYHVAADLWPP